MNRPSSAGAVALRILEQWHVLGLAAIGAAAVVAGGFEPGGSLWVGLLLGVAVALLGVRDARGRLAGLRNDRPFGEYEGPLLWIVAAFAATRVAGSYSGHLVALPAGLLAWLAVTFPRRVAVVSVGATVLIEVGLTAAGSDRQTGIALVLHLLVYGGAVAGLRFLAEAEVFRRRLSAAHEQAATEAAGRERARDFGLLTAQAPAIDRLPDIEEAEAQQGAGAWSLDHVDRSIELQLEVVREALGVTTAALLWLAPGGDELHLRGHSTTRDDLDEGPYPRGAGVTGSLLQGLSEVSVAPVKAGFRGLPYYDTTEGIGSLFAVAVPAGTDDSRIAGILCVDRRAPDRWTESERRVVRLVAEKLALDVGMGQRLKATDHERTTIRRFCAGLRELNGVLGLEAVGRAAVDAVKALAKLDFAAVTVIDGDLHRIVRVEGYRADDFVGLKFTGDEGLLGQAIKIDHPLPAGGDYRGGTPVFTAGDRLSEMRSLLILPLDAESSGNGPIGALVVAARAPGLFTSPRSDMLELIAAQVAIKLDLAQAHEQIREMATTDGLTGLANHRVFQQAFDNMLVRAKRRDAEMCMILIDIDRFKVLNDTYGHPFGDQVLKRVSRVLADAARQVDLAARYGGEEFAVLLEDSDVEGGRLLAERIREEVEALDLRHEKGQAKVTLSLGISAYPADGEEKALLISRADQALYVAKESGRNRAVVWRDAQVSAKAGDQHEGDEH